MSQGIRYSETPLYPHTTAFAHEYRVRETVIEVEYPLVESQLKELDEQLEKAIQQLNWTTEGVYMYMYNHECCVHNKLACCKYLQNQL